MTPAARIKTAIDLLDRIERPPPGRADVPADTVVSAYFRNHRFVGAKDRRAVANAVFQTLRQRGLIDWLLTHEAGLPATNRFRALWTFAVHQGMSGDELAAACDGGRFRPATLSAEEARRVRLLDRTPRQAPPGLADQASFPAWLAPELERQFGSETGAELTALTRPAPADLRVNTLKATRAAVLSELAAAGIAAAPTPISPLGVRLAGRVNVPALLAYRQGRIEVQDEGSQLAALLVDARPGMRVLDYCAGAGGKSLTLAAAMANRGALVAHDAAPKRLRPLATRAARAGATIIRVTPPNELAAFERASFDRVLVDAPCSGSGTWRRQPDAKWRFTPERLAAHAAAQRDCLDRAAEFVRPGGTLTYVTCSLLPAENGRPVAAFLARRPDFRPLPAAPIWQRLFDAPPPAGEPALQLTPRRTGTDGFFVAILERRA
jgi:16S rRNA (cytosine967-C5)-methyltransferase